LTNWNGRQWRIRWIVAAVVAAAIIVVIISRTAGLNAARKPEQYSD
jgi:hypothetical protein